MKNILIGRELKANYRRRIFIHRGDTPSIDASALTGCRRQSNQVDGAHTHTRARTHTH